MKDDNLQVRAFPNCNITGRHKKLAFGFRWNLCTDFKSEVYVFSEDEKDPDAGVLMSHGNGHIRGTVKESFRKRLGTDKPKFAEVVAVYLNHDETVKVPNFIKKYSRY